ncbi:hypothetical protein BC829DRAFT_76720 [Chytridium lagenaria]|nr:hypothetical protein BC829DRAFT_76720 [Chytridium lagenaria]
MKLLIGSAVVAVLSISSSTVAAPTKHITIKGNAGSYSDCSKLRETAYKGCVDTFPQNGPLTSGACIDQSVRQADSCVRAIDNGEKPYPFNFKYPSAASEETEDKPPTTGGEPPKEGENTTPPTAAGPGTEKPLIVTFSDVAKSYSDCTKFLAKGNELCQAYPEWVEDATKPMRFKCINVNVAVGDKCFATPFEQGGKTNNWDFVYPKPKAAAFLAKGNELCKGYPEFLEDASKPMRFKLFCYSFRARW